MMTLTFGTVCLSEGQKVAMMAGMMVDWLVELMVVLLDDSRANLSVCWLVEVKVEMMGALLVVCLVEWKVVTRVVEMAASRVEHLVASRDVPWVYLLDNLTAALTAARRGPSMEPHSVDSMVDTLASWMAVPMVALSVAKMEPWTASNSVAH